VVTALDARLQELQDTVAKLVDKATDDHATPASPSSAEGLDDDVLAASRTLQLAKRTADATIAEAREEAARLLADARTEHDAILSAANEAADRELSSQRTALADQTQAWDARRAELAATFRELDAQLDWQRAQLEAAQGMLRDALNGGLDVPPPAPPPLETRPAPEPLVLDEPAADVTTFGDVPDVEPAPTASAPAASASPFEPAGPVDAPPTFLPVDEGVSFGTPPPEPEPAPTPFYPWSGDQPDAAAPAAQGAEGAEPPDPTPPVQRRGLFGH
jgi:vacuolar-type H+-ATPase subunit H